MQRLRPADSLRFAVAASGLLVAGGLALFASYASRRAGGGGRRALSLQAHNRARADEAHARAERSLRVREGFLSVAAHELRTPVTTLQLQVQGLLRLAQHRPGAPLDYEQTTRRLESVRRQTDKLVLLLTDLLDVAFFSTAHTKLDLSDIEATAVTREVVERFKEMSAAGEAVSFYEGAPVVVRADRRRLEQVLTNLLSNAVKYGRGRPIDVWVDASEEGSARICVKDRGIGIAAADQSRIFERFERAAEARAAPGWGLGLWIVRELMLRMGGTVDVESELGEGTTFTVQLQREAGDKTDDVSARSGTFSTDGPLRAPATARIAAASAATASAAMEAARSAPDPARPD